VYVCDEGKSNSSCVIPTQYIRLRTGVHVLACTYSQELVAGSVSWRELVGNDRDPAGAFHCLHSRGILRPRGLVVFGWQLAAAARQTRLHGVRASSSVEHGHVGVSGSLRRRGARHAPAPLPPHSCMLHHTACARAPGLCASLSYRDHRPCLEHQDSEQAGRQTSVRHMYPPWKVVVVVQELVGMTADTHAQPASCVTLVENVHVQRQFMASSGWAPAHAVHAFDRSKMPHSHLMSFQDDQCGVAC
jgi:hypothetical protein